MASRASAELDVPVGSVPLQRGPRAPEVPKRRRLAGPALALKRAVGQRRRQGAHVNPGFKCPSVVDARAGVIAVAWWFLKLPGVPCKPT